MVYLLQYVTCVKIMEGWNGIPGRSILPGFDDLVTSVKKCFPEMRQVNHDLSMYVAKF